MDRVQSVEELQGVGSRPSGADAKPSFTRASILFVASVGALIGTSLVLASMGRDRSLDMTPSVHGRRVRPDAKPICPNPDSDAGVP